MSFAGIVPLGSTFENLHSNPPRWSSSRVGLARSLRSRHGRSASECFQKYRLAIDLELMKNLFKKFFVLKWSDHGAVEPFRNKQILGDALNIGGGD